MSVSGSPRSRPTLRVTRVSSAFFLPSDDDLLIATDRNNYVLVKPLDCINACRVSCKPKEHLWRGERCLTFFISLCLVERVQDQDRVASSVCNQLVLSIKVHRLEHCVRISGNEHVFGSHAQISLDHLYLSFSVVD